MSLDLDTGILNQSQETTTSMADMYGYAVFSEEFQQKLTLVYKKETEQRSSYVTCVFQGMPNDKSEQVFRQVFAAPSTVVVKEDFSLEEDIPMGIFATAGYTMLGGVLAFGVWRIIERIKKRRHIHEDYRNHAHRS